VQQRHVEKRERLDRLEKSTADKRPEENKELESRRKGNFEPSME
jgi:hypothetical protein